MGDGGCVTTGGVSRGDSDEGSPLDPAGGASNVSTRLKTPNQSAGEGEGLMGAVRGSVLTRAWAGAPGSHKARVAGTDQQFG